MTPEQIFCGAVGFFLLKNFWELYLDYRQYKVHLTNEKRPDHVAEIISIEDYDKARLYKLDKHRFGFVKGIFQIVKELIWLLTKFTAYEWYTSTSYVDQYFPDNEYAVIFVFFFIEMIINSVLTLPFSYYSNFVVEEKFGFNKQVRIVAEGLTSQTRTFFFIDTAKKMVLAYVLTCPIVCAVIWIIRAGGDYFFIYLWVFVSVVVLVMMTIYPEFIAPLFDKYTPLPESELKTKIEALASRLEFPLTKLYVVEGSKRSAHSNAYMYGFWKNKRIVLYDTLLSPEMNELLKSLDKTEKEPTAAEKEPLDEAKEVKDEKKHLGMSDDEVVAVLGHELGHWKLMHTLSNLLIAEVNLLLMFAVFSYFYKNPSIYAAFGFHTQPALIGLSIVTSHILGPFNELIGFAMIYLSRQMEFAADRFSAELGYAPLLCSSLIKLGKDNLSMPIDDYLYSMVNHSHPPVVQRIEALKKYA